MLKPFSGDLKFKNSTPIKCILDLKKNALMYEILPFFAFMWYDTQVDIGTLFINCKTWNRRHIMWKAI